MGWHFLLSSRYKSQIYVQKSIVIPKVQFITSSRDQSPALLSSRLSFRPAPLAQNPMLAAALWF
jgi:hypothetical protein